MIRHRRRAPAAPIVVLAVLVGAAAAARFLPLPSPMTTDIDRQLRPPVWIRGGGAGNFLGTDPLGRDTLSRLVYGGRVSLTLGAVIIAVSAVVGTAVALVSGYYGGVVDDVATRVVDATLAMPIIFVALLFAVIFGPGLLNLVSALSLLMWARFARVLRGEVLRIRSLDFVESAQAIGCAPWRIMARHVLPNLASTILVLSTTQIGWVILAESSLSFLGLGVPPPTASWGNMIASGREYLSTAWWLTAIPGVVLTGTVAAMVAVGDWLRDRLDPQWRGV